jgi:hypothetical protein
MDCGVQLLCLNGLWGPIVVFKWTVGSNCYAEMDCGVQLFCLNGL